MSARIERYEVEPEQKQEVGIRLPSYTGGPQTPVPDVSDSLLNHLRDRFPNKVPLEAPGENPSMVLGRARGRQEVIQYLEHLHKTQQEK